MTKNQTTQLKSVLNNAHHDYQKGLNARAFFKMQDRAVGEDLVQETFIKTWAYLVKGGKIDLMRAFLYHVLNGLVIDQYRKHKTTSLDLLREKGFEPSNGDSGRLFDIFDGKAAVFLINCLPITYQKVMRMRYVQDLSLEEISILTRQSKNTIAVQAHRGLEKLKLLYDFSKTAKKTSQNSPDSLGYKNDSYCGNYFSSFKKLPMIPLE